MDCDTLGIEPEFALIKLKKLAGGGSMLIPNQSLAHALRALQYDQNETAQILKYLETYQTLEGAPRLKIEHSRVFATASGAGDFALSVDAHLGMLAVVQPWISGGISKTVNLPSTATVDEVESVYLKAWKLGLKALALYRDGSKGSQPLSSVKTILKCDFCGTPAESNAGCTRCLNCGRALGCN
jgi:ribonucleoside-diphosphate reductase alpha chain